MLNSIFILRENGVCLYERHWVKTEVDAQLFSGFIIALSAFALESVGEKLQSLKLVKDQRLAILKHKRSNILGVIIADIRDNNALLNEILQKILEKFYWRFRKEIESDDPGLVGKTYEFYREINLILQRKVADRNLFSSIMGYLVGSFLATLIALIIFGFGKDFAYGGGFQNQFVAPIVIDLTNGMQPWEFWEIQQISFIIVGIESLFFLIIFFGPGFLGAYIAGNRILGVRNGILLAVGSFITILIIQQVPLFVYAIDLVPIFIPFSPILLILNILTGYFGGYLRERTKLWPIKGEELSEKVKSQITILIKKTFDTFYPSKD